MKQSQFIKQFGIAILAVFLSTQIFAQNEEKKGEATRQSRHDKIEQLKIGFITKELDLSTKEAQEFWPVYNEMSDKLKAEKKKQRKVVKDLKTNGETYSESDFKNKLGALYASQSREIELKKEYNDKIAAIIGYKKSAKLLSLEQRFKRELLNKVKSRPGGQNGGRRAH